MTQTFTELEKHHLDFYVPAYRIIVNTKDLLADMHMEIASVEVDNTLKGADRFSFTVNSLFSFQASKALPSENAPKFTIIPEVFAFGNAVTIHMGYANSKEVKDLPVMIEGKITSWQTSFPASGLPQITVSGYDHSYCMTIGKGEKPLSWANKTDSEVVAAVARRYGLSAEVEDTQVRHPMTVKGQESDMQFLERLAERNGYELYMRGRTLRFRPPAYEDNPVVSLQWGAGLISFSPEINISEQVSTVEVRGWDINTKKEIVGTATRGEEPGRDPNRQSGAELLARLCPNKGPLKVRIPVFSRQEAKRRAEAILKKRSEMLVKGSGESIGLPEICVDKNIELLGLGVPFSERLDEPSNKDKKRYYVEQSTHTINSSGYKTTFKVKEPTI